MAKHNGVAYGLYGKDRYDCYRKNILLSLLKRKKFTKAELSEELGLSSTAVHNALTRGNSKLRRAIQDLINDELITWDGKFFKYIPETEDAPISPPSDPVKQLKERILRFLKNAHSKVMINDIAAEVNLVKITPTTYAYKALEQLMNEGKVVRSGWPYEYSLVEQSGEAKLIGYYLGEGASKLELEIKKCPCGVAIGGHPSRVYCAECTRVRRNSQGSKPLRTPSIQEALQQFILAVKEHVGQSKYDGYMKAAVDGYTDLIIEQQKMIKERNEVIEGQKKRIQNTINIEQLLNFKTI